MSKVCDLCAHPTDVDQGRVFTADEFRQLVARGLEPDSSTLRLMIGLGPRRDTSRDLLSSPQELDDILDRMTCELPLAAWKTGIVAKSTTQWLLCVACAQRAATYGDMTTDLGLTSKREINTDECSHDSVIMGKGTKCPQCGFILLESDFRCSECYYEFRLKRQKATDLDNNDAPAKAPLTQISQEEFQAIAPKIKELTHPDKEIAWFRTDDGAIIAKLVMDQVEQSYLGFIWIRDDKDEFGTGPMGYGANVLAGKPYEVKSKSACDTIILGEVSALLATRPPNYPKKEINKRLLHEALVEVEAKKQRREQDAAAARANEEEERSKEAARLNAERAAIHARRKSEHRCIQCGRAMGLFDRLLKRSRHGSCLTFVQDAFLRCWSCSQMRPVHADVCPHCKAAQSPPTSK